MSEETPDLFDLLPKGTSYDINRNRVKEIYWLANPQNQVYKDEDDDIYVIQRDSQILVVGYLHCLPNPYGLGLNDDLLEFICDLKKLCVAKEWTNFELFIISDFRLRLISPESLLQLPKDIKFYILENNILGLSPPMFPKQQNLKHEFSESQRKSNRRIKSGPSILDEDPNSERAIMRALKNGDGDRYGL